ncbi:MAG: glycosyltransferase [Chloroflexota bacterium]
MSAKKMTVLSILPSYIASTVINVDIPLRKLAEADVIHYQSRLEHTVKLNDVADADIIVLCRNVNALYHPIYELATKLEIPIIYVLDDDIMGAPKGGRAYHYHNQKRRINQYHWLLDHSSLIRVHSPTLQETIHESTKTPTSLVWAPVPWDLTPPTLPDLQEPYKLVYAATAETGDQVFSYMEADLHKILKKYPQKIEMHFMGYIPEGFEEYKNVKHIPFEKDYESFFHKFTRSGFAIGFAPMIDSKFHKSKTDVKYRDYAAAGAVGIYMSSELYNASVIDGKTGLIVSGEEGSWIQAIERLILDPDLMQQLRKQARDAVHEKYHMDVVGAMWLEDFAKLPQRPPLSAEGRQLLRQSNWDLFIGARQMQLSITKRFPKPLKEMIKRTLGM